MGNTGSVHLLHQPKTGVVIPSTSPRSSRSGSTSTSRNTSKSNSRNASRSPTPKLSRAKIIIEDSEAISLKPTTFLGDQPTESKCVKVHKSRSADHLQTPETQTRRKAAFTLPNIPRSIVRQLSFGSSKKVVVKDYTKEDEGNVDNNDTIQFFFQKTGSERLDVLYDSHKHGFDQRELVSRITCKKKLLFVFQHNDGLLGWYQSDAIKPYRPGEVKHSDSETMFLFGYSNKTDHYTLYDRKEEDNKRTATIYNLGNPMIIDCFSAFWIDNNSMITFNPLIRKTYSVDTSYQHPFLIQKGFNVKIPCNRFLVFQCL